MNVVDDWGQPMFEKKKRSVPITEPTDRSGAVLEGIERSINRVYRMAETETPVPDAFTIHSAWESEQAVITMKATVTVMQACDADTSDAMQDFRFRKVLEKSLQRAMASTDWIVGSCDVWKARRDNDSIVLELQIDLHYDPPQPDDQVVGAAVAEAVKQFCAGRGK